MKRAGGEGTGKIEIETKRGGKNESGGEGGGRKAPREMHWTKPATQT